MKFDLIPPDTRLTANGEGQPYEIAASERRYSGERSGGKNPATVRTAPANAFTDAAFDYVVHL